MTDIDFMRAALAEAKLAAAENEVPIGAVAVRDGVIVAKAHNQVERLHSVSAHAEFLLLHEIEVQTGDWRLTDYTFFITKEPCPMCAGMLINARIKRVVFALPDPASGGFGGAFNLNDIPGLLWHCQIDGGLCAADSHKLIKDFFERRREERRR